MFHTNITQNMNHQQLYFVFNKLKRLTKKQYPFGYIEYNEELQREEEAKYKYEY